MATGLMTPYNSKWQEFIDRLQGPEGCNFREDIRNTVKRQTWDCDNTPQRPLARKIMKSMGLSDQEIEQSLGFFHAGGGHCDCEIVFNVEEHFKPTRLPRLHRRKNPNRAENVN